MRITLVIDAYPPSRAGGATIYVVNLAEALVRMGLHVDVICAGTWDIGNRHFNGVTKDVLNGVHVHRINLNWRRAREPFNFLYDNETLAPIFRDMFLDLKPDVVHINSCLTLSARVIEEAQRLGIPTVLHLHDFWFLCALQNLVRKDGSVCSGPESAWKCQSCVLNGTRVLRLSERLLSSTGQQRLITSLTRYSWIGRRRGFIGMLGDMQRRQAYLQGRMASVSRILVPARFMIDMYRNAGFSVTNFEYRDLGIDVSWAPSVFHRPDTVIRFGYIGHLQYIKGIHILIEAFSAVSPDLPIHLSVFGAPDQEPSYVAELRSRSSPNVYWEGAYSRGELAKVLSLLDVIVVPSICHEIAPLVIKEAFAAGVPVITIDRDGPAELVEHEVNGLHFRAGSVNDLRRAIERIAQEPDLLYRLRSGIPKVKTITDDAQEILSLYSHVMVSGSRIPSAGPEDINLR